MAIIAQLEWVQRKQINPPATGGIYAERRIAAFASSPESGLFTGAMKNFIQGPDSYLIWEHRRSFCFAEAVTSFLLTTPTEP
jgi:hypothetical protein